MENKAEYEKRLSRDVVLAVISALIMICCLGSKYIYYLDKMNSGFFGSVGVAIPWALVSMGVSVVPATLNLLNCLIAMARKKYSIFMLIVTFASVIVNLAFELISILGAGMTLNVEWLEMAEQMLVLHAFTMIIVILTMIKLKK